MRNFKESVCLFDRLIAAGSYVTMGMIGFAWLIICAFLRKNLNSFLRYHIFQACFLVMGYFLISIFIRMIFGILSIIPFINMLVFKMIFFFSAPIIFGVSLINAIVLIVMTYLVLTCLQGKYSYLPWVSNIIDSNVRGR